MPLEREPHLLPIHAAAIVGNLDQLESARGEPHADLSRAGIQSVFDQFLKRARGPLDHFPGGDAIDELGGQPSY